MHLKDPPVARALQMGYVMPIINAAEVSASKIHSSAVKGLLVAINRAAIPNVCHLEAIVAIKVTIVQGTTQLAALTGAAQATTLNAAVNIAGNKAMSAAKTAHGAATPVIVAAGMDLTSGVAQAGMAASLSLLTAATLLMTAAFLSCTKSSRQTTQ